MQREVEIVIIVLNNGFNRKKNNLNSERINDFVCVFVLVEIGRRNLNTES